MSSKFIPFFNQSLGKRIESREELQQLERAGNIFMSVSEYESNLKSIKKEQEELKLKARKIEVKKKFTKLKFGHSFSRENNERARKERIDE